MNMWEKTKHRRQNKKFTLSRKRGRRKQKVQLLGRNSEGDSKDRHLWKFESIQ